MADAESPPKKKSRASLDSMEGDGEFKFSNQSRRTRGPKKSRAKSISRSAKKRRSSFVRGRKERKSLARPTVPGDDTPDLYKDIPTELPPTGRLRKLFDASLELALTKLAGQPSNIKADIPDFENEAKEVFDHLRQLISESDIIDEACQPLAQEEMTIVVPNPQNEQLEKSAFTCKLVTQRLQKETSRWHELLLEKQKLEEKTKKELQECMDASGSKEECPDFLSLSQHKLLSGKPAFKSLTEQSETVKQTALLQVDKVRQVVTGLQQYKKVTEGYLNKHIASFGAKSLDIINDMGTPRTLIRGHLTGH